MNPATPPRSSRGSAPVAALLGVGAMCLVGGSAAVSGVLAGSPFHTAQALRYAAASVLLVVFARTTRRPLHRPRGVEWLWLLGVTASGLVVFNVALIEGSRHAEPAVLAVAVACVPLTLSLGGAVFERRRPPVSAVVAAAVVTVGAVLVTGVGRADAVGIGWACVVLVCESGFTLLAIPLLPRHGAWGVSVHTTWLAAVAFALLGLGTEGPGALVRLDRADLAATVYLAVGVTAVAFVLWYTSVGRLGAGRAGLLTSFAPVAAAVAGVLLGGPVPRPLVWLGIAVIAVGLLLGFVRRPGGRPLPARPVSLEAAG